MADYQFRNRGNPCIKVLKARSIYRRVLFWVHAAVAYLLYRVFLNQNSSSQLTGKEVLTLAGGALLPDLVDKPLAFVIPSLPSRSVAHSVFITFVLLVVVGTLANRASQRDIGIAFAFGYLSHLSADLVDSVFIPEETLLFLFWPVITEYHHIDTINDLLALLSLSPYVLGQYLVTVIALLVWVRDGKPGYRSTTSSGRN